MAAINKDTFQTAILPRDLPTNSAYYKPYIVCKHRIPRVTTPLTTLLDSMGGGKGGDMGLESHLILRVLNSIIFSSKIQQRY